VRIVGVGKGLFPLVHQVRRCTLEIAGRELVDNSGQKLLEFGGEKRSFVTGRLLAKIKSATATQIMSNSMPTITYEGESAGSPSSEVADISSSPLLPIVEPLQRDVLEDEAGDSQLDQSLSSIESNPRGCQEKDLFFDLVLLRAGISGRVFDAAVVDVCDFVSERSVVSELLWGGSNTVLTLGRSGRFARTVS
jgi:hypothetical protein